MKGEIFYINLGEDLKNLAESKMPNIVFSKRAGSLESVRVEEGEVVDTLPWDDLED